MGEAPEKRELKNNVPAMKQKLAEIQNQSNWIERLDLLNAPAPLAPELAMKEDLHIKERQTKLKQEKLFYRQAQAAVMEGLPRLQSMNVRTRRPGDYFTQMAKSDQHMNKIREKLLSKEQSQQRAEKVSKLREMKKIRKGQGGNLDFLDGGGKDGSVGKGGPKGVAKKNFKDKKFGFGGKKKGLKKNDKKSADDVSSFRPFNKGTGGGRGQKKNAKAGSKP